MRKVILILLLAIPFFEYASETQSLQITILADALNENAQKCAQVCSQYLTKDELTLLANFLYYDFYTSYYEYEMRSTVLALQRASHSLTNLLNNPTSNNDHYIRLQTLLKKLYEEFFPSYRYFLECWKKCDEVIKNSNYKNLNSVINDLQKVGQNIFVEWAHQTRNKFEETLQKNIKFLSQEIQQLHIFKGTLQSIIDHKNSFSCDAALSKINDIDTAISIAQNITKQTHDTSESTDQIAILALDMLDINILLFGTLYKNLYIALEEQQLLPLTIMVNHEGLIPIGERHSSLPFLD